MAVITMKQLLEAGVHFGHQTKKWNPKMAKYIYDARNDIHIVDLELTVKLIEEAYAFIKKIAAEGKPILFVGKKKQAKEAIQSEAERCGMYYMNHRWLGGTLTNFATIRTRIEKLNKLNNMEIMGEFELLPKKEVIKLKKQRDVLEMNLGGIKNMRNLPGAIFAVDLKVEHIALKEARALGIPVVGLVDTNCDPEEVDYVIPGNDDAIRAIKLIASVVSDAIIEANEGEEALIARKEKANEAVSAPKAEAVVAPKVEAVVAPKVEEIVAEEIKEEIKEEVKE